MPGYADLANMQMPTMGDMAARLRAKRQQKPVDPNANMDPRAAQIRALVKQGLTLEQAMQKVQQGG